MALRSCAVSAQLTQDEIADRSQNGAISQRVPKEMRAKFGPMLSLAAATPRSGVMAPPIKRSQ
jgi:hypothetical protein